MTLHADSDHPPATAPYKAGSEVAVFFDASELPEDLIAREGKVLSAITAAFDVWTTHTDIEFVQVADAELVLHLALGHVGQHAAVHLFGHQLCQVDVDAQMANEQHHIVRCQLF